MNPRKDYLYNDALNDLENFIDKYVIHEKYKIELLDIISESRVRKTVPMRGIYEKYIRYVKEYGVCLPLSDDDKEMISDLMYFWG